ncbi:uncharacterized protein SOCEGT47_022600 [Sorangium cellulosum]|uniref:Gp5/Type VI secretion system Vgr protein OB-fold domain-containing protein n=1 Tax=Sorangium cellulosum TaxID=56 RepID=A0A4V0ND83_SORCE|nr:type VI secretion system tip protein VgrG [Sorangium cellulosum]AUX21772.1 uncharacterized protein SOCEGT47_022600 [Sorangium cellulosum]
MRRDSAKSSPSSKRPRCATVMLVGIANGQLLVVRSRCTVTEGADGRPARRHVLDCVPAGDPWRPARRPRPRISGTHTAFVVGNQAGVDEIDIDEHGRVEVELRWDRRDLLEGNPTRFVRVSQGWAGLDDGMVMLLRVNEEVIIAYLDGDPDEPIVVGRLHNAWSVAPLKLPAEKTRSIWKSKTSPGGEGFHPIMMEDKTRATGASRRRPDDGTRRHRACSEDAERRSRPPRSPVTSPRHGHDRTPLSSRPAATVTTEPHPRLDRPPRSRPDHTLVSTGRHGHDRTTPSSRPTATVTTGPPPRLDRPPRSRPARSFKIMLSADRDPRARP